MSKAVFALMAAGTVVSAYGAYQQGKMQKDLNNYNARIAENNSMLALRKYEIDKKDQLRRYRKLVGEQRVSYAKAGVAMEGSAIDIIEDSALAHTWELAKMKYNSEVEAAGYRASAAKSKFVGESAYAAGKMKATSTLLTGGTETYKYGKEQNLYG
tara:strand:+ start:332 stop:799 length:468 start_codon:yes stop_codon:yes gene_type:complete